MEGPTTLRFATQASMDVQRMMRQLTDLQRQVASGNVSNDLAGFGDNAATLLNTQTLQATSNAKAQALSALNARFGVQASALDQVAQSASTLAKTIRDALSANDGRTIDTELNLAFSSAVSGLNETWNGQPLFAGERVGNPPVKVDTLQQLLAATGPQDIYDEAARPQVIDLGTGTPIKVADKASELSQPLFDTFTALQQMINQAGGQLPAPLTQAQRDQLTDIATQLDAESATFTTAEGRAGQLQQRFTNEGTRLTARSNLLAKAIGDQSDADIAQISIQINTLMAQYQASAKTFTDISKLSILAYL